MSETKLQEMDLDIPELELAVIPVKLGGKNYVLREAPEGVSLRYRNALTAGAKLDGQGNVVSISSLADTEVLLVVGCLFEVYDHQGQSKERPVTDSFVKALSHRKFKLLYERALAISGLGQGDTESIDKQIASLEARKQKLIQDEEKEKN